LVGIEIDTQLTAGRKAIENGIYEPNPLLPIVKVPMMNDYLMARSVDYSVVESSRLNSANFCFIIPWDLHPILFHRHV